MRTRKEPLWQGMPPCRIVRPSSSFPVWWRPADPAPTVIVVHRYDGRTLPCEENDCPFDSWNVPTEERLFIRVWQADHRGPAILELPPTQWKRIAEIIAEHGALNTLLLAGSRPSGKQNGKIELTVGRTDGKPAELVGMPELIPALRAIWAKNVQTAREALFFKKSTS